jgi:2-polyprenyl-3-methyl-5-hydroxy-6-metoxy-1,4-benzoquinol methylase
MYETKMPSYFAHCRTDMLAVLPRNGSNRILEVGAGCGETLLRAKALGLAAEVVAVELVPLANSGQSDPGIDRFIIGDIEKMALPLEQNYFDVVLCGDVLEHLVDPWSTVKKLTGHLKPGGHFIASMPNFREIRTLLSIIIGGSFSYLNAGILDRTHLRFFCKKNMRELLEQNGLTVMSITSNLDILGKGKRNLLNRLTFKAFAEFLESEYLLVARKERD